ncbi:MAG: NHL repeat-containing protein [Acidiferrobacteraceae bacterium]
MANEPTLTEAERKVITCAAQGTVAQYTTGNDQADDPAQAGTWGPERTISAEVLYALAMGTNSAWPVHPKGIQITGARITGSLDFQSAEITRALVLHDCALERVDLQYAQARLIDLSGSHVLSGIAATCLKVSGSLILAKAVVKDGIVLEGARIDGNFECAGGYFKNPGDNALSADQMHVRGNVFLSDGFTAEGTVRLPGAEIGGQLACHGGHFKNPDGDALNANSVHVKGGVFLNNKFTAEGEVRLLGAKIGGDLACHGGHFKNPNGAALDADGMHVGGNVFLRDGFTAEGEVRLPGAEIGGQLACSGGHFKNPGDNALSADQMHVRGDVFLRDGFTAEGTVRLPGAEIGGQLACHGGHFKNPGGEALIIERAKIAGTLFYFGLLHPPEGAINFICVQVGQLVDDPPSWPVKGQLRMDGFEYGVLAGTASTIDVQERLQWLALQPEFRPQPYEQLICVLRRMGHEREARQVAIAKQKALRKHLGPMGKLGNWLLGATTGYGYQPWRAFFWMMGLVVLGAAFFSCAHSDGTLVPAEASAYVMYQASHQAQLPSGYPAFHAALYSIDVAVPFVDLGQKTRWQLEEQPGHGSYWFFESWFVIQELAGWVLLLIAAVAPTRLIRKD